MAEWLSPQQQEHMALAAHMVAGQERERAYVTPTSPGATSSHPPQMGTRDRPVFHPSPTGKFTSLLDLLTMMSEGFHTEV